jgi:hypothetical protein
MQNTGIVRLFWKTGKEKYRNRKNIGWYRIAYAKQQNIGWHRNA